MNGALDCVANLIAYGLPVFACRQDKRPATRRGFLDASTDRNLVSDMFGLPGAALIGVPTGAASGLDALDLDPRHNGHLWWRREAYRLPLTRQHRTRSGGLHLLFRAHPDVRCSQGLVASGVDVRAGGGYAIWWAAHGGQVDNPRKLANWPEWLLEAMQPKARPTLTPPTRQFNELGQPSYGAAQRIFETALARLERAAEGERHITLRKVAFTVGGILQRLPISRAQAVTELVQAVMCAGAKDEANAMRTALWGVEQGEARPLPRGGRS